MQIFHILIQNIMYIQKRKTINRYILFLNVRGGFNPIQQPSSHHFQYNEDSSMANDFDNEEDQLNRVIAESMAMQGVGGSQQPVVDVNDTEEELLRQIMEQSKREAGQ